MLQRCDQLCAFAARTQLSGFASDTVVTSDGRYLNLLRDAFNGTGSGRGLHFSFDVDVTQTQQRASKLAADAGGAAKPLHATAESRFFWNQKLLQPLIGAVPRNTLFQL